MEYKTKHPLYNKWRAMMHRCYNHKMTNYKYYGGRGITVCERWHDFLVFADDIKEIPDGFSLDRIDVNGNYEPSNVRIANASMQARNKRFKGDGDITLRNGSWNACVRVAGSETAFYRFKEKSDAIQWRSTAIACARAGKPIPGPTPSLLAPTKPPSGTVYIDKYGRARAMVRIVGEKSRFKSFDSIDDGREWCRTVIREILQSK